MRRFNLIYLVRIFSFLLFIAVISGCVSHRAMVLNFTQDKYQKLKKYPIKIRLEFGEGYQSAKWERGSILIPFGSELTRHANILAEQMFDVETTSVAQSSDLGVDAILIAEIISIDHQFLMWAGQESKISVVQKWTLKDSLGNPIWIQTVTGSGVMETGTIMSEGKRSKERALLAIDDLYNKSSKEMSSSIEIKKFVEIIRLAEK